MTKPIMPDRYNWDDYSQTDSPEPSTPTLAEPAPLKDVKRPRKLLRTPLLLVILIGALLVVGGCWFSQW
jgi:hypothetical protein